MKRGSDGLALVGRVLLGLIFVISGWGKLTGFAGATGYIASSGLPIPQLLAGLAVVIELGGGLALILGFETRLAALALVVFMIVVTPIFHGYWDAPAAEALDQQIHFLKNVSILGGILMVMAFGPGRLSFDKN